MFFNLLRYKTKINVFIRGFIVIPVVISGGSGTRLWPVSRSKMPKQFCQLFNEDLQMMTLKRAVKLGSPIILTSKSLQNHTEKGLLSLNKQMPNINAIDVLYEPQPKNTAAALAYLSKYLINKQMGDEVVVIMPSDQLITKEELFTDAIKEAITLADKNFIVTLGIKPDYPATGYGYIETRESITTKSKQVVSFYEKPNYEKAKEYFKNENFYWNAGLFIFKPNVLMEKLKKYNNDFFQIFNSLKSDLSNLTEVFEKSPNLSIDYALMEKLGSDDIACVPCDANWSDVGSWDSVAEVICSNSNIATAAVLKNQHENRVEVYGKNNFVYSSSSKTYAFAGVDDVVLVDTPDALLISKKGQTQHVKSVVETLKNKNVFCADNFLNEERPWGSFEVLKDHANYKVKIITVEPGEKISYQSHDKREEHWTIIKGKGEVILNNEVIPVGPGTYVKIPLKSKHRIVNTGLETIQFLELQLGSYFGEDDIIRYEDSYKRL